MCQFHAVYDFLCRCEYPFFCCIFEFSSGYDIHRNHFSSDTVHYHVHKGKATPYIKVIPAQVSATDPQYKQSQKRCRRATITYGLPSVQAVSKTMEKSNNHIWSTCSKFFFIHFRVDSEDCAVVNFRKIHCLLIWCLVCYNLLSAIQYFCKLWNLAYKQGYMKFFETSKAIKNGLVCKKEEV